MVKYIALLRGINVSGQKKIKMDDLRTLMEEAGFASVKSYIQSGNLILDHSYESTAEIAHIIEEAIMQAYGFAVPVFAYHLDDFILLMEDNPLAVPDTDISGFYMTFLDTEPEAELVEATLAELAEYPETIEIRGRVIYLDYPNGYGRSKLTNNLLERKLKVGATTRNWKTVNKLIGLGSD